MSKCVNGGIYGATSKKALKDQVASDASAVRFFGTSAFGIDWEGTIDQLPEGITLIVAGPDPYTKRNWFANIVRTPRGVTVK